MPTKKQRRRRLKDRRHEYEYVYVDDQGQEVEVEEPQPSTSPAKAKAQDKAKQSRGTARPVREPKPPSWERQLKRAPFFGIVLFLVTGLGSHQALTSRIALAALYSLLFIPFMYLFERGLYRAYLKRTGKLPPRGSPRN